MKEKWDLYDVNRNKTGLTWIRGMAIPKGYYHLVVSVWIQNDRGEYLLSRRHPNKQYPLCWECTGGSVLAGEDSLIGAVREVKEELGIILNPAKGRRITQTCREKTQDLYDVWAFHENIDISDIILQETEVIDVKWVIKRGLIRMAQNGELHPLLDIGNVVNEVI